MKAQMLKLISSPFKIYWTSIWMCRTTQARGPTWLRSKLVKLLIKVQLMV